MKDVLLLGLAIFCLIVGKLIADTGGITLTGQGGTGTATTFTAGSFVATTTGGVYSQVPTTFTKVQLDSKVPDGVGQMFICSNCTVPFVVCVATGTLKSQYVAMKTGSGCGTDN